MSTDIVMRTVIFKSLFSSKRCFQCNRRHRLSNLQENWDKRERGDHVTFLLKCKINSSNSHVRFIEIKEKKLEKMLPIREHPVVRWTVPAASRCRLSSGRQLIVFVGVVFLLFLLSCVVHRYKGKQIRENLKRAGLALIRASLSKAFWLVGSTAVVFLVLFSSSLSRFSFFVNSVLHRLCCHMADANVFWSGFFFN